MFITHHLLFEVYIYSERFFIFTDVIVGSGWYQKWKPTIECLSDLHLNAY